MSPSTLFLESCMAGRVLPSLEDVQGRPLSRMIGGACLLCKASFLMGNVLWDPCRRQNAGELCSAPHRNSWHGC